MKKVKPKDFKGNFELKVSLKDTIPYRYFFKKIRGKVYRFSQIGDEEWRKDLMPFKHEPYVYWSESKPKTLTFFERIIIYFIDRFLRMVWEFDEWLREVKKWKK